jgi:hypothetical protein
LSERSERHLAALPPPRAHLLAGALLFVQAAGALPRVLRIALRCVGSAAQPYRVTATLTTSGGIAASTGSCPVGGRCKHVAALLLAWLAPRRGRPLRRRSRRVYRHDP